MDRRCVVADSSEATIGIIRRALRRSDFHPVHVLNSIDLCATVHDLDPCFAIVAPVLLDVDGIDAIRMTRRLSTVPLVYLAAITDHQDRARALAAGADCCASLPICPDEIVARARALTLYLRAHRPMSGDDVTLGSARISLNNRIVTTDGESVALTRTEHTLLVCLAAAGGSVVSHTDLLHAAWGHGTIDVRLVHTHISHLRRKLHGLLQGVPDVISVPGVGYRISPSGP